MDFMILFFWRSEHHKSSYNAVHNVYEHYRKEPDTYSFFRRVSDYSSAEYSFKITNGEGDIYADFSGSGLNVFNTISEAEIKVQFCKHYLLESQI